MKTIKLNQMENKITKEELESIVELQGVLNKTLLQLGALSAQKHSLLHEVAEINKKVEDNKVSLEQKYGAISINLEDGSYTEAKKEA